jgi:hypothetical protein
MSDLPSSRVQPAPVERKGAEEQKANRCICPVCGGETMEIRGKAQCRRCHTICETCCEGGRQ